MKTQILTFVFLAVTSSVFTQEISYNELIDQYNYESMSMKPEGLTTEDLKAKFLELDIEVWDIDESVIQGAGIFTKMLATGHTFRTTYKVLIRFGAGGNYKIKIYGFMMDDGNNVVRLEDLKYKKKKRISEINEKVARIVKFLEL